MPASRVDRGPAHPRAPDDTVPAAEEGMDLAVDLFERYHGDILAYLCSLVHERAWAQDLAQDTFLRLLRARRRLPQIDNRRAWLYRIATNVALDALKRRQHSGREASHPLHGVRFAVRACLWPCGPSMLPWRADDGCVGSAPDVAEQVSQNSALEAALAALPPAYRAPLLLYQRDGLNVAEVATALGLSQAAARKRIYRALEMLRRAYGKGDGR